MLENKSMHNFKIVSFLLFLLFSFGIYGQSNNNNEPKIIPPSPTAYELGRYGQADVGTFTGTPNISVPVYTYKTKNIAIPIALNYNSNGIQVDQMETNVGLGWNLNTGGIINRIVRGQPDEKRNVPISTDDCFSDTFIVYIEKNQFKDMQPDLYSYNFQGHSGQFVFDDNGKAVLVPQNNLKIEKLASNIKSGFKITTEDGVEYQFYDIEYSTWENVEAPQTVVTGWYLTKIIHPEGDVVNFTYKGTNYSFVSTISESFGIKVQQELKCDPSSMTAPSNRMENHLIIMGKIIESISSNEAQFGSVTFQQRDNPNTMGNYLLSGIKVFDAGQNIIEKADFNYLFTTNKRIFLSECIFKDTSKKYSFEYEAPDDLVARLSDQRDLWGYYNGKPGTYPDPVIHKDLYPQNNIVKDALMGRSTGDKRPYVDYAKKGILKKIVYPTNGYNEFQYEANTIWTDVTGPLELKTVNRWFYNKGNSRKEQTETFVFENKSEYETEVQAKVSYDDYDLVPGVFPEGELIMTVTIENLTDPMQNSLNFYAYQHNIPVTRSYKFLKNNTYRVSLIFSPEPKTTGKVHFTYCLGGGIVSKANIPVAGLRIKEITSFDTRLNTADVKHYYYGKKETPDVSSGTEGVKIKLLTHTELRKICDDPHVQFTTIMSIALILNVNANSVYPLYKSMGNNSTTYENVTVSHGGTSFKNGGEEFFYDVSADMQPYLCLNSDLAYFPWINSSWNNGLLRKKIVFDKRLTNLNIVEYNYKLEDQYTRKVPGIATDYKYNPILFFTSPDYKNIEHLNISKYTTNSYWFYLESEKNTQYDLEGLNPIVTQTTYKYNNALHQKLSSQTTTSSTGENIETKYFYASDPEMASEPFRNELVAQNMIGKVLDTQTLKQGAKLSEQKTVYDKSDKTSNLLLPGFIYANKGIEGINNSTDKKLTFDKYDEKGNILQYTLEAGIPVSIIWGYNKTQPIAKIENLAYGSIPAGTINNLQTLSNADTDNCMSGSCTEQLLRNGLNALRTSLPDAFISTYTYNPLVGVTSVTDPKGTASYYEYNSYGRLKFVKDKDLNVLQKYCYNYKGQQIDCNDNESTSIVLYRSAARSGSFTKTNCAPGGAGATVVYNQVEGVSSSTISQIDADAKATDKFNTDGQIYADTNPLVKCTFLNTAQSRLISRNNCEAGGSPSSVWYTVAAGIYSSDISQAAADAQAQTEIDNNAQAFANSDANAKCTFLNTAQSRLIARNNCEPGGLPASVWYTVAAGTYSSDVSQVAADAQAVTQIDNNGQAFANSDANAKCTFLNAAQSRLIARNNCEPGGSPASVWYTVAAGTYSSDVSQAAADAQAVTQIDNNAQAFANSDANAKCSFLNTAQSRLIARNNCEPGGSPSSVWYTVAAGIYSSDVSQAAADAQAIVQIDNNGQAFANDNSICTFYSTALSGSFTKNNCDTAGYGSSVPFGLVAGTASSNSSQADADAQALNIFNANGQANANATGYCTFYSPAMNGYFTKDNCSIGGAGSNVYYSQDFGIAYSHNSQTEANALGSAKFYTDGQAYANTYGDCTFMSAALSGPFQKNDCPVGGVGSPVDYSLAMGAVSLKTSQGDVDAQAWNKYQIEGQANANAYGYCTFKSATLSGSFTKSNCDAGGYGSDVAFSQVEGAASSNSSQADADAQALNLFNANGQAYANVAGYCTFYSPAMIDLFIKNNCDAGGTGSNVYYNQGFGVAYSHNSQAEANVLGSNKFNADGQAYANANGVCTFRNSVQSRLISRNNCSIGGIPDSVWYTVAAGAYASDISQAAADASAELVINIYGQAYANANADCTFRSTAVSGSFQKNTCVGGAVGSFDGYALAEGAVVLKTSQAHVNSEALAKLNAEGQANANASGECLFYNVLIYRSIRRTYCPRGTNGTSVLYKVSPKTYSSLISQADANQKAEDEIDRLGQPYADKNGVCNQGEIEEK
ncbi:DUF5977 domain-containing protein [Flavobacterium sp. AC]|uniref:DUF5977 domain-containing protein n=1 Tax=Flavobacterium azizsancarii TaxID=2961580 RepID=A0ABT4WER2_9FLAO|nr:DUF5977 domain-containing protein [Flavobacterium azizsancarii]MDA6071085.1 DUF5977 domain-containing protein [Flavobacterium azizsancarii]